MSTQKARLKLTIYLPEKEESVSIDGHEFIFGRSVKSDVHIPDQSFSRSHFKVFIQGEETWISDMAAPNGTYLNEKKLETNSSRPLNAGDVISIDGTLTKIFIEQIEVYAVPLKAAVGLEPTRVAKAPTPKPVLKEVKRPKIVEALPETSNEISILMDKIIEDAQNKANEIVGHAEDISSKELQKSNKEAKRLILEAQKKADEIKAEAHKKATIEFTEEEKEKVFQKVKKDTKVAREEFSREKKNYEKALEEHEELLKAKQSEISHVNEEIDLKKQKLLEAMHADHIAKKAALEKAYEDLEAAIFDKKNEFSTLDQVFNEKKAEQLRIIEVQMENRKFELLEEVSEYEEKVESNKKEFEKLFENYEHKKSEQAEIIAQNTQIKERIIADIKALEKSAADMKVFHDTEIDRYKSSIHAVIVELNKGKAFAESEASKAKILADEQISQARAYTEEQINKLKNSEAEEEDLLAKLNEQRTYLESMNADLLEKNQAEELFLTQKKEEIQALQKEMDQLSKEKDAITPQFESLNNRLADLKKQIELGSRNVNKIDSDYAQKVEGLERKYLESKSELEDKIRKLTISEEKRVEELLRVEMTRINKLKEDSLRLIIDLEDSISKEIGDASAKIFATTIGVDKYREIAPQFDKALRSSLQSGVLKMLHNELNPTASATKKKTLSSTKKNWKPMIIGMSTSALVFGLGPYAYKRIINRNETLQLELAAEAEARRKAQPVIAKFMPQKVKELGTTFVKSVVYTENFCETYALENFRSELIKQGSIYLYKQWQIPEEKSIESYAIMFSLIDALKERRENVNPEFETRDIGKMVTLENETMKKVEALLGNEVRVEAALKFQKRFYNEFIAKNELASEKEVE